MLHSCWLEALVVVVVVGELSLVGAEWVGAEWVGVGSVVEEWVVEEWVVVG